MTGKELNKWADEFMFEAEKSDAAAGPVAYLLGAPQDPLAQIAACAKMYKGEVVRDLADVTNDERLMYLQEIQKTALKMPLESVSMHFMLEGVHRGITHQMVRQRTGAYAQESTRFAVKRDLKTATALPPSLDGTYSLDELVDLDHAERASYGLSAVGSMASDDEHVQEAHRLHRGHVREQALERGGAQAQRILWDEAVDKIGDVYNQLVDTGMAAEDARGLMPTNITTRLNYITNLRSFYDTMAVRVSDQAQFEWRMIARAYAMAMIAYGETVYYWTTISKEEYKSWNDKGQFGPILERVHYNGENEGVKVRLSSAWQYRALAHEIKPIEFVIGRPAFGANFDRPSRIGERVAAFAARGVPSSQWTQGAPEHGIPPISPEEWLLDPNAARLDSGMEFDVFGNRVPKGTGWHWNADNGALVRGELDANDHYEEQRFWPRDFIGGS